MQNYDVTVVVVTWQAEKFIEGCVRSILENAAEPVQLIVIDGASTDRTLDILSGFPVDVLISEKDNGIYDAMNKAIPHIKGRWALFLGADDRLLPSFNDMAAQLQDGNTLYYGDCVTEKGILGGAFSKYRLTKMNVCHQGMFYPTAALQRYPYDTRYRVYADYVLNFQCWGDASIRKQYLPIQISAHALTGFSSFTDDIPFRQDKASLVKRYLGPLTYWRYRWKKYRKRDGKFF